MFLVAVVVDDSEDSDVPVTVLKIKPVSDDSLEPETRPVEVAADASPLSVAVKVNTKPVVEAETGTVVESSTTA